MRQQNAYLANMGGGAVTTMCNMTAPFQGQRIRCSLHASVYLLQTTKINGSIECKEKKITIFDEYLVLASITSGLSRVINIWMVQYSL